MADPDTFRVSPSLQGLPSVGSPAVESQTPQMLVRAGQTIQRTGGIGAEIFQREVREQNATRVTEDLQRLLKYQHELTYDPDNGWVSLQGKNALDREKPLDEEYGGLFDERVEQLSIGLGNDAQRKLFRERANVMGSELRGQLQRHVAEQGYKHTVAVRQGIITENQRMLGQAILPEDQTKYAGMIRTAAEQLADMQGMEGDQRAVFIRDHMTPGHLSVIGRMMTEEDVDGAMAYAQNNRGDISQDAWDRLQPALMEQQNLAFAADEADRLWAGFEGVNTAATETVQVPIVGMTVTSAFGPRGGRNHNGVDIAANEGTPVVAGASGTAYIKSDPDGWGTYIEVKADDGHLFRYAHLSGTDIQDGDRVTGGQVVGRSGGRKGAPGAGNSTGAHLHYEVIGPDGEALDPQVYHRGKPKINPNGAPAEAKLPELIEAVRARTDIGERQKTLIIQRLKEREGERRDAQQFRDEAVVSQVYANIDRSGSFSNADRALIEGAGLGSMIPAFRSFAQATTSRRNGDTISEADGLAAYGQALEMIADGTISSVGDLLQLKPYLPDNYLKQLMDDVVRSPQQRRQEAESVVAMLDQEVKDSGLFEDEEGKKNGYERQRFLGSVERQLQEMRQKGPVSLEDQRRVVLGLLGNNRISALGVSIPQYRINEYFDRIPRDTRARLTRGLQRNGIPQPGKSQVVSAWLRLQGQATQ